MQRVLAARSLSVAVMLPLAEHLSAATQQSTYTGRLAVLFVCRVHRHVGLRLCVWGAAAASRVDRQGHHTTAAGAGFAFAVTLHVLAGSPCSGACESVHNRAVCVCVRLHLCLPRCVTRCLPKTLFQKWGCFVQAFSNPPFRNPETPFLKSFQIF